MQEDDPFSDERAFRIYGQLMTAHKLCWEAGDIVFRAASTAGARDGARMQRYWRDLGAFRTNGLHQLDFKAPVDRPGQTRAANRVLRQALEGNIKTPYEAAAAACQHHPAVRSGVMPPARIELAHAV